MAQDLTSELLHALLTATDEQKRQALQVLRGADDHAQPVTSEPYLTLKELARLLNFHVTTLWRWQLPAHFLWGRRRYRVSEVEAYFKSAAFHERLQEMKAMRRQKRKATESQHKRN